MKVKIYNTETRQKEEILSLSGQDIRLYTCGPTVYDFAHIGNFRTYVAEDLLRRTLKFFGFLVTQVMNITDIDDKTIQRALKANVPLKVITESLTQAFFEDLKALNIETAEFYPRATDYIPYMISMIEKLLKKGIAYQGNDQSIYFNIQKFPSYGRLSHLHLKDLQVGASQRIIVDEYNKDNVADFVLWKAYDSKRDGDIYWESPFGKGRPGWHIECSAMGMEILGKTIDIHAGGVDNIFPHHENEIAQSEAVTSKSFVRYWFHVEHLRVENKKMSKSLGNFLTLRNLFEKGYTAAQVRYVLLQTHYRIQLNFTTASLDAAARALDRLQSCFLRLEQIDDQKEQEDIQPLLQNHIISFKEALADDLNISLVLSTVFDLVREVNVLCDQNRIDFRGAQAILAHFHILNQVLGFLPLSLDTEIQPHVRILLEKREQARLHKAWKEADHYRDQILDQGYLIEDTPLGPRLKRLKK